MALVKSFQNSDFEQLSEADLKGLVTVGVPEGISLEYKSELYGGSDADVKEFLKDCSSFANTAGGYLVIGIEERDGVALRLSPVAIKDADQVLQRLESLCRDGIDPRIVGLRMKAVPIDGGYVFVIKVPISWRPPHRVTARNANRFYARNSAGAYEVSLEELRALFLKSGSVVERVRAMRDLRLIRLESGEAIIPLAPERSMLVLHLVPFSALSDQNSIDLERAQGLGQSLHPLGQRSFSSQFNFEGFATYRGGAVCHGYTQVFRSGAVEATYAGVSREHKGRWFIPSLSFDERILEAVPKYLSALRSLEISSPIALMITLQGVGGSILGVQDHYDDEPQPMRHEVLKLPEIIFEAYGSASDYIRAMRPAFDALWNAAGYVRSRHFDVGGSWVGNQSR